MLNTSVGWVCCSRSSRGRGVVVARCTRSSHASQPGPGRSPMAISRAELGQPFGRPVARSAPSRDLGHDRLDHRDEVRRLERQADDQRGDVGLRAAPPPARARRYAGFTFTSTEPIRPTANCATTHSGAVHGPEPDVLPRPSRPAAIRPSATRSTRRSSSDQDHRTPSMGKTTASRSGCWDAVCAGPGRWSAHPPRGGLHEAKTWRNLREREGTQRLVADRRDKLLS